MEGENRERWMKLAEEAAIEKDPGRLMELIRQINELLEAKEQRLKQKPASQLDVLPKNKTESAQNQSLPR